MQLNEPDAGRSAFDARHAARTPAAKDGFAARLASILSALMLVLLGFLIAVALGMFTGVLSPTQLVALVRGEDISPAPVPTPSATAQDLAPESPDGSTPGAAAAGPAAQPARVLREETFGDWRFFCLEGAAGAAPTCSAVQQLRVAETGAPVFIWRISQSGNGGLVGIWQVPETVLLSAGMTLDAGGPQPLVVPFESCGGGTCQVVANLAPDFIATLAAAETLSASVVLSNRQNLKFPLSSAGLADALAALAE